MTIDEISTEIKTQAFGLLSEDEINGVIVTMLWAHGGIDPEDISGVVVTFKDATVDIGFVVREQPKLF